ncbi:MAG TPA: tRNA pseudouridine(55) synthase TruB [Humidesulfovibrio sp.]|uniref:tRNA pseudouridine(55) synthase TruB n=1 Tax=Humidesulfovibrio sp. TaxID=2910988 RepID=UPI002C92D128|nr:tRNA pseudouridine(55) synthase TruB [Humidesulfovibrio sp.]HWR04454.1 tRNA pseudouridine(55) synthase TruB [Humidesulfovibrio sp.]
MGRKRKRSAGQLDGLLVLNKPSGPTSAGCLNSIKHGLGQGKIGHAGTLDPLAQGVLLVLLGQGTKLAGYLTSGAKVYTGMMRLGLTTDTFDMEGAVVEEKGIGNISQEDVRAAILSWKDLTEQEVPAYSAAKHEGKPLYELARKGETVPVKEKRIEVYEVEPLEIELPFARFRVRCLAGTYIRSLVHSLGIRLGCGAALAQLTREACEPYGLDASYSLDAVLGEPELFAERVVPLAKMLPHWRTIVLSPTLAALVKNGAWLPVGGPSGDELLGKPGEQVMLVDEGGEPVALAEAQPKDGGLRWTILRGLWMDAAPAT